MAALQMIVVGEYISTPACISVKWYEQIGLAEMLYAPLAVWSGKIKIRQ